MQSRCQHSLAPKVYTAKPERYYQRYPPLQLCAPCCTSRAPKVPLQLPFILLDQPPAANYLFSLSRVMRGVTLEPLLRLARLAIARPDDIGEQKQDCAWR